MSTRDNQAAREDRLERTLHLRVRDRHARLLLKQARLVNFVWNYDNELCAKVLEREGRFLSGYDLHEFTHDRDVNSARNHLAAGHRRLAEGILAHVG